ncbi:MAG: serine/threonine-protein kinase [Gemmatimonadota bacterium]
MERRLGEGGTSFVYRAIDRETGEPVAIKILSPRLAGDPDLLKRLRREAALVGRLDHPGICRLHRLGESEDGLVYLVLAFLPGELLNDREIREGPFGLSLGLPILFDLCRGLGYAHDAGIVHRDLKPENVMLVPEPSSPNGVRAVLLDFGLARPMRPEENQRLTATGVILGTPDFLSPEQMRGQTVDHRSDIYALGLLAFEMFAGQLPFAGRASADQTLHRLEGRLVPLGAYRPDLPPELGWAISRALAPDPASRFQSAAEFQRVLEAVPR